MFTKISSGIGYLDHLLGFLKAGDNVIWEVEAGTYIEIFLQRFIEHRAWSDNCKQTVFQGSTIFQAAREFGIHIPTMCYMEHLSPHGGCRICVVEISNNGSKPFVDTSYTYEVREGIAVETKFPRIIRARTMLAELLVSSDPNVNLAEDIAARMGLLKVRFPMEDN